VTTAMRVEVDGVDRDKRDKGGWGQGQSRDVPSLEGARGPQDARVLQLSNGRYADVC
jgi:hypothetical protein